MHVVHSRASRGKFLALLASLSMVAAGIFGMTVASPASATPSGKIRICHATAATSNPYVSPTVDMSSIDEANNANHNGHGDHTGPVYDGVMTSGWGDIIPPFKYDYIEKGKHGQPDKTVTIDYPGLNWTTAGQSIYYNGCDYPPKPDTQYRTVYWCSADVRHSKEQSSTDGGVTWKPSAPAGATTDSSLKCGQTPIERTVYWCESDERHSRDQVSTDGGVTWKPSAPAGAVEDSTLKCGSETQYRTMYWCESDQLKSQKQSSTDEGATWSPSVPADAVENDSLTCGDTEYRTMYWCEADTLTWSDQTSTDGGVTWSPPVPETAVEDDTLTCGGDPDPEPKPKPEVTYYDDATLSATQDICTANGTVTINVKGTGLGESKVSQPDAKKVAEGNAQLDLDYNLRMAKAQFPGATEGACALVEPTVVEPAVVEPAVEEPAAVNLPAKATVAEVPEAVAVPAKATVPTAVPAGEGPADSGLPIWALVLIVAGAAGAAITGARVLKNQ